MEKELNIEEILKDKPKGLKLWSPIVGECKLKDIAPDGTITIEDLRSAQYYFDYLGRLDGTIGETVLFPSKSMRDWRKFAWKKGDVLATGINTYCIFDSWENGAYTQFRAKYICRSSDCHFYSDEVKPTCDWTRVKENDIIEYYINIIERSKGGKLNLETLEIEKPQFKDGDIVFVEDDRCIVIFKRKHIVSFDFYACLSDNEVINYDSFFTTDKLRPATDSEKQQLFSALEKEGKAWDAEKKAIVNLPKKCEFKVLGLCLMRDFNETWKLCQFGFMEKGHVTGNTLYDAVGGNTYEECIPYNDQTAHLLGTTDDWKGGEA